MNRVYSWAYRHQLMWYQVVKEAYSSVFSIGRPLMKGPQLYLSLSSICVVLKCAHPTTAVKGTFILLLVPLPYLVLAKPFKISSSKGFVLPTGMFLLLFLCSAFSARRKEFLGKLVEDETNFKVRVDD
ncbi:unnamed protein product [Peronospora belbahrii]|uniref:Uncharacterized protein n=1 Tax=Peronospora belbahrii TaxID=622444 RepID=A0ABN8CRZ3_9STRA|nr:unnamed protein product [Peronospora belbahrii]